MAKSEPILAQKAPFRANIKGVKLSSDGRHGEHGHSIHQSADASVHSLCHSTEGVIVLDDSTDEEVAVRTTGQAAADKIRVATAADSDAPPTKKPRVEAAAHVVESNTVNGSPGQHSVPVAAAAGGGNTNGDLDVEYIPGAFSGKKSISHREQQELTADASGVIRSVDQEQSRRSRRSFADTLSFSELQAQQRALEYLQAVAHRKGTKKPTSQQKAKLQAPATPVAASAPASKSTHSFSAPKPASKPAPQPVSSFFAPKAASTAPRPLQRAASKPIPTYESDSDSDFEPTPMKKPVSRVKPDVIPVSPAKAPLSQERELAHVKERKAGCASETISIVDNDIFSMLSVAYEKSTLFPKKPSTQSSVDVSQPHAAKPKRKRPSNVAKKSDERKSSSSSTSKSHPAAFKQSEPTVLVSDILPSRRDISNTVIHNTSWRQCYFDVAPVNLLPSSTGDVRPCLMSQIDPPLTSYDTSEELEEKCKILSTFGKANQFVSSMIALDTDQEATQAVMDKRVSLLVEHELPKIQECYRLKTTSILKDVRAQVSEFLRDHELHKEESHNPSWKVHKLKVDPAERFLIRQMEVPKVIPSSEHSKLKYFVGYDESNSRDTLTPSSASRLCKFHMHCRSTTFIGIKSSIRVEDDPILRYIPYFGDNESGEEIDVKQYEKIRSQEASQRSGLDGEVNEYFLRFVVADCGDSPPVFTALKNVYGFNQGYTDYSEIKKNFDAKRLTSRRIEAAKSLILEEKVSESEADTHAQLTNLFKATAAFGVSAESENKPLAERLAPPPTYFESNLARRRTDQRASRLGLRSTDDYADLSVHYRDLFCRMCYKYDCHEHGIEHPQPIRRADPINPPLRLSPVAFTLEKESQEEKHDQEEDKLPPATADQTESNVVEIVSPDNSVDNIELDDEGNNTDENESASSGLASDRRRSARSQTRASTMATAFLDGFPLVERSSRPSRPSRAKVVRKVPDESEYLDDSHCAMVNSKMSTFLGAGDACSETCWKTGIAGLSSSAETKVEISIETGSESLKRDSLGVASITKAVAAGSSFVETKVEISVNGGSEGLKAESLDATSIKSVLSPAELVLLQKTREAVSDNPCMIASIVKSVSCKDLHKYLETENQSTSSRTGSMDESAFSPDVRANKNLKRGRNTGSRNNNNNRELLKRTRNQRLKEKGSNHEYEPCNHDGVCDSSICSCMTRDHMCEKACSCSRDCPNRFQGCRCSMGNCRTNACPCFVAMRECNPDVCFTCGASEVPALIYNEELQGRPALELGICCNVNLTRGIHKKLGVSFSTTHGWGTFAREPIKRGEFIYEYKGAIISQDEAERRGSIYDKNAISFLFDANEDAVIDAIRRGNKSKFANHSNMNPKCKAKIFRVGGEHRVAIWAQQDIKRGEELFFNYGYSGESAPDWSQLRIKDSHRSTKS